MIINSNRMNFAEVVSDLLGQYGDSVVTAMTEVIPGVAKEASKKLRQTSPKKTGAYRKSWHVKTERKRIQVGAVVYAKAPGYRMAHLLEYGHATRGGGREKGKVEHIKPVEEWAIKEAEDRIIDRLERNMR